jgi:hypothetical protein
MDALHYRDFDLDIDPAAGRRYSVRVLASPDGGGLVDSASSGQMNRMLVQSRVWVMRHDSDHV